ncbi:unnamed protein product [Paramecium sonneborni]|uniref:Uncharacterized protein n=1 Tax=Paramecium sonneborni TaxID=65129 RepID=A0A8S1R678_9CILI|nr:unnamed protein product [Paramecium sonneborni]
MKLRLFMSKQLWDSEVFKLSRLHLNNNQILRDYKNIQNKLDWKRYLW